MSQNKNTSFLDADPAGEHNTYLAALAEQAEHSTQALGTLVLGHETQADNHTIAVADATPDAVEIDVHVGAPT